MFAPAPAAIRLPLRFDAERMQREVAEIRTEEWLTQKGPYHDGRWHVCPLVSVQGRIWDPPQGRGRALATPILQRSRYLTEVVDAFRCRKERVRLSRLPPGLVVGAHRDDDGTFRTVRVHVAVGGEEGAELAVDGEAVRMAPGEAWFVDVSRVHSAANRGEHDRVHLIVDCYVNGWIRGFLPQHYLLRRNLRMVRQIAERRLRKLLS